MSVLIKAGETTYKTNLSLFQTVQGNHIWHQFHREDAALTHRIEKWEEESQLKVQVRHFSGEGKDNSEKKETLKAMGKRRNMKYAF